MTEQKIIEEFSAFCKNLISSKGIDFDRKNRTNVLKYTEQTGKVLESLKTISSEMDSKAKELIKKLQNSNESNVLSVKEKMTEIALKEIDNFKKENL